MESPNQIIPGKRGGWRPGAGRRKTIKPAEPQQAATVTVPAQPAPVPPLEPVDPPAAIMPTPAQELRDIPKRNGRPPTPTIDPGLAQLTQRRKTPLERLYDVMGNPKIAWQHRIRAMIAAAEYVHAKQPQAVHVSSEVRIAAVHTFIQPGPWLKQGFEVDPMPENPHAQPQLPAPETEVPPDAEVAEEAPPDAEL